MTMHTVDGEIVFACVAVSSWFSIYTARYMKGVFPKPLMVMTNKFLDSGKMWLRWSMATVRQVMMNEYGPPGLDCFGQQLNRAARAKGVEFSRTLHQQILRATIGQRLVCLAGKSRQCFVPTVSPLSTCCVATTALSIVCAAIVVTPSQLALPPAEQAPSQTSISFTDVVPILAEATDEVESIARLASEDLVDSLVLQHVDFVERHAKDIVNFWLDPLPSSLLPELHKLAEDVNKDS